MTDRNLEHPDITRVLRDGLPSATLHCSKCGGEIGAEYYAEWDGEILCIDCVDAAWKELTAEERIEKLGYDAHRNGEVA